MIKNGEQDQVLAAAQNVLNISNDQLASEIAATNLEQGSQILLMRDVSREQVIALQSLNLSSIELQNDYQRYYPNEAQAFSTVVGYVGQTSDSNQAKGLAGLEKYYDSTLRGIDGETITPRNAQGQLKGSEVIDPPQSGQNVTTTIDGPFQQYFYDRMLSGLQKLNRTGGVGLAIDPRNGQVLAMVSFPTFDPNNVAASLNDPNEPLFNRAVSGQYSPGSTIKPLDATAVLKEGVITTTKQILSIGYITLPNPYNPSHPNKFLDWQPQGWVDIYSALARSSDVYFYEVCGGFETQPGIGITKLEQYWNLFGLGKPTGINLPGEASGFIPDPSNYQKTNGRPWTIGDTYNAAIGQGDLQVTPIQLLDYISAIANNGPSYKPSLLLSATPTPDFDLSYLSPQFTEVRKGMGDAVSKPYGTAYLLNTLPFQVAAKTGSAQTNNNTKVNALFVGYAPANAPQVEILVLIENGYESILNAVPIAKDVMAWYYQNRISKQ
jgi:penicillin-binding protein 2